MEVHQVTEEINLKKITIPFLADACNLSATAVSILLDKIEKCEIEHVLWDKPAIIPKVCFTLAYNNDALFVKFEVTEPVSEPVYKKVNDPVYGDSCVELFIAFGNDAGYYNLEFNALGTCLGQFGCDRNNREFISPLLLEKISSHVEMESKLENLNTWQLTIKIPFIFFTYHNKIQVAGQSVRINFFKCGDDLPNKHYMAWNNISSKQPNFHLPEYFGVGTFE